MNDNAFGSNRKQIISIGALHLMLGGIGNGKVTRHEASVSLIPRINEVSGGLSPYNNMMPVKSYAREGNSTNQAYVANDPLVKQDAVVIALSLMGVNCPPVSSELLTLDTDVWATNWVSFAMEKGIIRESEEIAESTFWGISEVTREWMLRIVVRALKQDYLARSSVNIRPPFKDADQISSEYIGYVNAAIQLGIINGYEDQMFRPQDNMAKVEFSSFVANAELYANLEVQVKNGRIIRWNAMDICIIDDLGKSHQYTLHSNVVTNGSLLKSGDRVSIVYNQDTALYIEPNASRSFTAEKLTSKNYDIKHVDLG
ncbi:S-layer homology domain-containing protein [Paenibacillus sp. CMAA1364]